MVSWLRALLFVAGGVVAATGTAYYTGLLDPLLGRDAAVVATLPGQTQPPQQQQQTPEATALPPAPEPDQTAEADKKQDRLIVPTFDLLRVEPDGSVVIAGKAAPDAKVEVLLGDTVLSTGTAGPEGDFVAVFDKPLDPGDYQLSLRAISGDGAVTSIETAIVSIPQNASGQVLAMVEAPGQAAELISVPQAPATTPAAQPKTDAGTVAQDNPATTAEKQAGDADAVTEEKQTPAVADDHQAAAVEDQPKAAEPAPQSEAAAQDKPAEDAAPTQAAAGTHTVSVDAVEIEGGTIFVAGQASPGLSVRVYAGDILLGDTRASEGGRFLVEAKRDLPVGSYVIRADVLGKDGAVVARAAVPFEREPGETIAAVAPQVSATQSQENTVAAPQPTTTPPASASGEMEIAAAKTDDLTAPALKRVEGAVIIRRGDSLWRISRRVYGHGVRYSTIYLANQDQIADPNRIWPGQVFAVPGETSEGEQADMSAIGDQSVAPEAEPAAKP